jgi:hypothetical protein
MEFQLNFCLFVEELSLAKNHPAKNFPPPRKAKNTPSEESSGRRILQRGIFRPIKKITVAKNSPAKNHPSDDFSVEELSGEEFS